MLNKVLYYIQTELTNTGLQFVDEWQYLWLMLG